MLPYVYSRAYYSILTLSVEHSREMQSQSKKLKHSDEVAAEMKEGVYKNHIGFGDKVFNQVGSGQAQHLARVGGSMLSQGGEGAFRGAKGSGSQAFAAIRDAATPEEKKTVAKAVAVDTARAKLTESFDDSMQSIQKVCAEAVRKCESMSAEARDSPHKESPSLTRFVDIMDGRAEILKVLMTKEATVKIEITKQETKQPIAKDDTCPDEEAFTKLKDAVADVVQESIMDNDNLQAQCQELRRTCMHACMYEQRKRLRD